MDISLESIVAISIHSLLIFILAYIYQESHQLDINLKKMIVLSILISIAVMIFFSFSINIFYLAIVALLGLTIMLYLINFNDLTQILYFSMTMITLVFYINFLINLLTVYDTYVTFYDYQFSLFLSIIILLVLRNHLEIKFSLPLGKIRIFILSSSILLLMMELIFFNQFSISFNWNLANLLTYLIFGLIYFNYNIIIQYLYNDFFQLTIAVQNNFISKITNSYLNTLKKEQNKTMKIKHDMKNNLLILQQLLNNNNIDEAIKVLQELNHRIDDKKIDVFTGNLIIDAYLTNVMSTSAVMIQIKSSDLKDLDCQSDLLSVFINIVDNAIANTKEKVMINIDYQKNNSILLKVSNDCLMGPGAKVKKATSNHGYGLRIVQDIVNKYLGTYLTSYKNHIFTTYIMLELRENDEK